MDRLEQYIRTHRDAFDDQNPDPAVWETIAERLPRQRAHRRVAMWKAMSVAAVGLVLLMSGIMAGLFMGRDTGLNSPEYAEFMRARQYYDAQYQMKKERFDTFVADPDVDKDLKELDKIYQDLSGQLEQSGQPNREELINALIQIYQARIQLLERVLDRVEDARQDLEFNTDNEKIKI